MTGGAVVGIGHDLVEVRRLGTALERTPSLVDRLFTAAEQASMIGEDPITSNPLAPTTVEFLAGRFAVKEAVMKVLGVGIDTVALTDVEVERTASGAPAVRLSGRAAERARAAGITRWHVSISHTAGLASAMVVGCD